MTETTINLAALKTLKTMIGGDADDLAELIEDFVSTLPIQVEHMKTHAAKSDWSALRITSHSCNSNSRDLGALQLAELCADLEMQCKDGEVARLDERLEQIADAANAVIKAISELDPEDV